MSERKQQQKILLRKPKKGQRSPSGVSESTPSASASFSKGDGAGGARSVSTASNASPPPPPGPKQPIWYRFRTALSTLLVMNAVVIGYTLFRTSSQPSDTLEEEAKEADVKEETVENVKTESVLPEPTKGVIPQAAIEPVTIQQETSKPKLSSDDQQELFKWILAEKRKTKPANKAEKAQLDAEKALLKEFLRGKGVLSV